MRHYQVGYNRVLHATVEIDCNEINAELPSMLSRKTGNKLPVDFFFGVVRTLDCKHVSVVVLFAAVFLPFGVNWNKQDYWWSLRFDTISQASRRHVQAS